MKNVNNLRFFVNFRGLEGNPEPGFNYMEVVAIETRLDQQGPKKTYDWIVGCLLGFAARLSFKNGHEGMLFLIAKTGRARVFDSKYGFFNLGSINTLAIRMASEESNSRKIISEYLNR